MSLAEIVRMKPAEEEKKEESEFNDKVVRDYRIIKPIGKRDHPKRIGEGKFSVVFKAQKISDGSQVALKLIKVTSYIWVSPRFLKTDLRHEWSETER